MAFGTKTNISKVLFVLLFLSANIVLGQSSNFSVVSGGGDWNSAATWNDDNGGGDADGIPDSDDNVTIDLASSTVTLTGNEACQSLTLSSSATAILDLNGNTLTVGGNVSISATLDGGGTLEVQGDMTINSGAAITGFPSFTFNGGTAQNLSGSSTGFITLNNFTVDGASTVLTNSSTTFNVLNTDGVMTISNGATFNPGSRTYALNQQTIDGVALEVQSSSTLNAGSATFRITQNRDLNVNNSGAVVFNNFTHQPTGGASLTFTGSYTINGTVTIADASEGIVDGGSASFTYNSGNLVYSTNQTITITDLEWPSSGGPTGVTVNSTVDMTLTSSRSVESFTKDGSGSFTISSGSLTVGTELVKGSGTVTGTIAYSTADLRYTTGQTAGDEWPISSGPENVTISSGTVTQSGGRTISGLTLSSSSSVLSIGSSTMDVNGNATLNNGSSVVTTSGGTLQITGNLSSDGSATVGTASGSFLEMNGSSQQIDGNFTVYNVTINSSGSVTMASGKNLKFNDGSTLRIQSGTLSPASTAQFLDTSNGTIDDNSITLQIDGSGTLETNGVRILGFIYNLNNTGSTVSFTGDNTETIPATTYSNLTINNSNSTGPNTAGVITIDGTLTLTDGVINNSSRVDLTNNATVSGGSNASYIAGVVAHTGTTGDKVFPVGKSGSYRPITLLGISGSDPKIRFELKEGAGGTPGTGITNLSIFRYWEGSLISGGFTSAQVRLSYGSDDGVDGDPANLRVAQSSSALGTYNSLGVGTAGGGVVTSPLAAANSIQFYRIGDAIGDNSLPVEMAAFEATPDFDKVTISWKTASEIENLGFNIYRRDVTSESWNQVNDDIIAGRGNYSGETNYEFVDNAVVAGQTYQYKLESVSINGVINVEKTVEIQIPVPTEYVLFKNYPNPFNPTTHLKFQVPEYSKVTISIYDISGRKVKTLLQDAAYNAGQHVVSWDATDQLGSKVSSGMYIYRFTAGSFNQLGRMLLLK